MSQEAITRGDFNSLRREVQEAKWLAYLVLQQLVGKKKADETLEHLDGFIDRRELIARFDRGTPVSGTAGTQYERLIDADLYTLEEVAAKPRAEVAAVHGVGPATLGRLEAAMADRGLSWAEA